MTYKHIIAIVIVCLTVVMAIAMIVGGSEQEIPEPQVKDPVLNDIVEDSYKNIFIEECNYHGADFAFCSCSWDYMENELGRQGLLDMADALTDDSPIPQVMIDATVYCMSKEI